MSITDRTFASVVQPAENRSSVSPDTPTTAVYISNLLREVLLEHDVGEALRILHYEGVALFVDIADSTSIVNRFGELGSEGVETLHGMLNRCFGTVFEIVESYGGDVVGIYGDAILAVWRYRGRHDMAVHRASAAALHIREYAGKLSAESGFSWHFRLVLSGGCLTAIACCGEESPNFFIVTGEPIQALASISHRGESDSIILTESLLPYFAAGELHRSQSLIWQLNAFAGEPAALIERRASIEHPPPIGLGIVPRMITDRVRDGYMGWLAEFRVLTVVFVQLPGIESAPASHIQNAVCAVERAARSVGLSIFQVNVEEKGLVAIIASGLPPFAQEAGALRAVQAAQQIHETLFAMDIRSSVGVSTGRVFCGDVGSSSRRECLVTGPAMHLAAGLMGAAAGGILCDTATAAAISDHIELPEPTPVLVKGTTDPIPAYRGDVLRPATRAHSQTTNELRGREREVQLITEAFERQAAGHTVVALIEGEPGAGKSRLLSHAARIARERHLTLIETGTSPIESATAYYACRALLQQLLLRPADTNFDVRTLRARLDDMLRGHALQQKAALIEDILPLDIEDKGLAGQITGPARLAGLEDIFVYLASHRAAPSGLVLLVDDIHWLDDPSAHILLTLVRRVERVLLVMTTRPMDNSEAPKVRGLCTSSDVKLSLARLSRMAVLNMTCDLLCVRSVAPRVADFVFEHSEGLPFHAEQLVLSLRDRAVLSISDGRCSIESELTAGIVPGNLRDLIVSRIDSLDARHQIAAKMASAIGRTFEIDVLREILPFAVEASTLPALLQELMETGILEPGFTREGGRCSFRHILIQEATYELLTFDQRKRLHRNIATSIESRSVGDLEPRYAELANHWENAGQFERAVDYWRKASQLALRRYANYDALSHVDRIERLAGHTSIHLDLPLQSEIAQIRADACHELSRFTEAISQN